MMDSFQLPSGLRLAALAGGLLLVYWIITQVQLHRRRAGIKQAAGTRPVPYLSAVGYDRILGLSFFRSNMAAIRDHCILELGKSRLDQDGLRTARIVMLGTQAIVTIEPENLKVIQAIDFKKWSLGQRRKTSFRPLLGIGIFTSDGQDWAHSREMLRPNFVRSQVADIPTFERHVAHLISAVPGDGTTVDLSQLFFRLTMDSATEFLVGESTESLTKRSEDGFAGAFNRSQDYIATSSRWGIWRKFFPEDKQFTQDKQFVHDFVDYYVQRGLAKRSKLLQEKTSEKTGRYVFLDELVRQTEDPIRIRSELLNILLAGRDTTASLLTNVWFVIAKRPDIWAKLQAEVATLNGQAPSYEQLKELKYLRAVLNESLRLHPVVPANSRQATEDTTLPLGGGADGAAPIFIEKGQIVSWNVYAMHRRKDYYGEDAEEFRPERWLDDRETGKKGLRPGWEYLPFNGGARICLVSSDLFLHMNPR